MSFRSFLIFMSLTTLTAWVSWFVVLHGVDPSRSGAMGFLLFYLTLSVALFGTLAVTGVLVRIWRSSEVIPLRATIRASRQAILFTILIVGSLTLFSQGWFRWWSMILVVLIVAMVELVFITMRPRS